MGALLTAILQGAGRAGNETAEAKTANLQEQQRLQQFRQQMAEVNARMAGQNIDQKTKVAPQVVHTYKAPDGKMHNLVRDPISGKITDQVAEGPGEMSGIEQKAQDLEKLIGRPLTPEEKGILGGLMPKPTATQSEFDKESDKLKADEELRKRNPTMWRELHPPRRGAEGANVDNRPIVDKAKDVQSGVMTLKDLPTKERSAVATYMREHKMEASPKFTADERKRQDQFKQIEPMIGRMANIFEQNPGLQDQGRGGMFSLDAWTSRSKTEKAWQEYSHGLPPADKTLGELIRRAAAIKVMGAGPWMSIGRGKYLYSEIVQHLPATNDTPAQLYDKLQFYRDILEDAKNALPQAQGSEEMLPGEVISQ